MNYLVTLPNRGILFTEVQEALEREFRSNSAYPLILRATGVPLLQAREQLSRKALEIPNWDILIMVDDDIVLPEGAFQAYAEALKSADVALIDYPMHHHQLLSKIPPTGVTVFTQYLPGEDITLKEVAWSGLGATALKRETLEKLCAEYDPLFKATAHPLEVDELGRIGLVTTRDRGLNGRPSDYSAGEDTQFFFDARRLGLKIKLIPGMKAQHLRLDYAISWASEEKYNTVHTIERSTEIERPGNELHRIIPADES